MKEREVLFSFKAEAELLELYEWIATAASPDVAFGYVTRIEAFCQRLGIASERGLSRDDIRPGLRIIGFERRVTVAFTVESDRVVILRLFYGGRDWETLMS